MISCERAQTLFGPAWDDELSVAERETLELHFTSCSGCRRDYDEYARTLELVQALPRPQVSGDFATRVLAEARRREAEGGLRTGIAGGFFARPAAVAMAAAVLVAIGVSGALFLRPTSGPTSGPTSSPAKQVAQAMVSAPTKAPDLRVSAGDPDGPITTEPITTGAVAAIVPTNVPGTTIARGPVARRANPSASEAVAAIPDSLFDHSADVEFVLDPVKLRRERGRGYTPVQSSVRGEQASITF